MSIIFLKCVVRRSKSDILGFGLEYLPERIFSSQLKHPREIG